MIEPTKHEDLKQNLLVVGGEIIKVIKRNTLNLEDTYQELRRVLKDCSLDIFYDSITLLWLLNFLEINEGILQLSKKDDVSQKTLL